MALVRAYLIIALSLILISKVLANPMLNWEIIPAQSKISFTGILNDAPTSGCFKNFSGDIQFDPNELNKSHVTIVIDTSSVQTSYPEIAENLKDPDWFDVKIFPNATFKASKFVKVGENSYEGHGTLTILKMSVPVLVKFVQENRTQDTVKVRGSAKLKRLLFNIGKGEWSKTSEIKDNVEVNFVITARQKK